MKRHPLYALGLLTASVTVMIGASPRAAEAQPATATAAVAWVDQFGPDTELYSSVAVNGSAVYVTGNSVGASYPIYLRRYSETGTAEWDITMPHANGYATPVVAADADQVCVGGITSRDLDGSGFFNQSTGFVRCLAHDGSVRGTGYVETLHQPTGYPPITYVTGILPSHDAVYVVGITEGTLEGSCLGGPCTPGAPRDAFIRKYDVGSGGALTTAWTRQVDLGGWDNFIGAAFDSTGNVRVWGTHQRFAENTGISLRCYETTGDECGGSDIALVDEAPFAGTFAGDAFYLGTQSYFVFQSVVRRYSIGAGMAAGPDPDWSTAIARSFVYGLAGDDDGIVLTGAEAPGHGPYDGSDAIVHRLDAAGNVSWRLRFGSETNDNAFGVAVNGTRIYSTGQTTGPMEPGATVSQGADVFVVRVTRPEEAGIHDLLARIEALRADGTLKHGQAHALEVKLADALEAYEDGDTARLVARLGAFINQVNAFRNAGILSATVASDLIGIAQSVIDLVS